MKFSREIKNWINRRRSEAGKSNGVVKWLLENTRIERMLGKNDTLRKRRKQVDEEIK